MTKLRKKNKLVHGVGINDADYQINVIVDGKKFTCPFYIKWRAMLERCYSPKCHIKHPTYIGCSVCQEWHYFMEFRKWMQTQNWENKQLDKDILIRDNQIYSPDTCIFIDQFTNSFLTDAGAIRGKYPLGVYLHKQTGKFLAKCFGGNSRHIGLFDTPEEAHSAYLKKKSKVIFNVALRQQDNRVFMALMNRYKEYKSAACYT